MRIRDLLGRRRAALETQLDEELEYHVSRVTHELVARGVDPDEARSLALERFGAFDRHRSAMIRIDRSRVRRRTWRVVGERLASGTSMAMRRLWRAPGFTLNTVAIFCLGIGANALMFGVVDRLLLRPPQHVADADRVRQLYVQRTLLLNHTVSIDRTLTFPDYLDMVSVGAFSSVGAFTVLGDMVLGRGASAEEVRVKSASASFFGVLGVTPRFGRFYTAEEDRVGAPPVAVLAEEFWERRFGGDTDVLGRTLDLGGGLYEIVGIAPAGFTGAELSPVDVWLPIETAEAIRSGDDGWRRSRGNWWMHAVARLAPGSTETAASQEATARHRSGRADLIAEGRYSEDATVLLGSLIRGGAPRPGEEASVARWLAGVSVLVLLIACFNVANLLLARATGGERETAVRLAMGAARGRLVGGVLLESAMLALLGGLAAFGLATGLSDAVHQALLPGVAFTDTELTRRVGAFALIASLFTGLAAGVLPALQSTRADVADALKSGARGVAPRASRMRVALLVGQASLSVVLLVGAGLFVKSLRQAQTLDLGFDAGSMAVVDLTWNETLPGTERAEVYRRVLDRLRTLPQVEGAALTYTVPFRSSISIGRPRVPGLDSFPRHPNGGPYVNKVGAGYFGAMGLEILTGRPFDEADGGEGAEPVTIVSGSMARALWPDADPVGRCLMFDGGNEETAAVCTRVVGVVENHRRQDLVEDDPHFLYYVNESHPAFQGPPQALMARVIGSAEGASAVLAREARAVSPLIRFVRAQPLQDYIDPQLRSWRLGASMFTAFGALALVVAAWGLYSVLAFDVARRRREIGVRSALGAGASRIVGLVVSQALALAVAGVVLGLLLAILGGRFIEPLLFQVQARDPVVYTAVTVALLAAAGLAGLFPAWRAASVDPNEALRVE